ncbi:glycosyltransferase family A protein [Winogradskyella sp.]|jgi:glycosyltransferase involved in cell wall biosynthesis|uniref:glycosyltransferase family 2 protein n=1 Tax=Winogradskyella sp. TaxID=1883156 RepID=UPI002600357B|nr:glycosyltransferase family A protein [Winogradskyella sp.]MCT4629272.1 glycosyltransferase family 2 protein [Winogradskyella sp.]
MTPFFSVVVSVYNKAHFVKKTIKSILNQSFRDFELIIIDDGSTDNSLEILQTIKDDRISIYTTKNQGVSKARNYGLNKANCNHIALCDGDDIWLENHLLELKTLIENYPDCGIYATAYEKHFFNNYITKPKFNNVDHPFFGIVEDYFMTSLSDNILWTSSVAIPKSIINNDFQFDENLGWGEDTDLWIRIANNYNVAFSSTSTAHKMIHSEENHLSLTKNIPNLMLMISKHIEEEKKNPSLKAFIDTNRFMIAMEAKLRHDFNNYKKVKNDINLKNLNSWRRLLLYLPTNVLIFLKHLKFYLLKKKLYRSPL